MELNIQEIDRELEKVSKDYSKLFELEQKLMREKKQLLTNDILGNKTLNRCKWEIKKRDGEDGFILKPILNDDMILDDIQSKLGLYPHGGFQLTDNIEIFGDDGDLYVLSSDIKSGIEFIKSQNIEIVMDKSILDDIASMEIQIVELKEFVSQFDSTILI